MCRFISHGGICHELHNYTWTRLFQTLQQNPSPQSCPHWPSLHVSLIFWLAITHSIVLVLSACPWVTMSPPLHSWLWYGGTEQQRRSETRSEIEELLEQQIKWLTLKFPMIIFNILELRRKLSPIFCKLQFIFFCNLYCIDVIDKNPDNLILGMQSVNRGGVS